LIIADSAHGHLFISQGTAGDPILVTNYAVAGGAVSAISTATLKQTASYPLPSGDRLAGLALQDGSLWVSYQNVSSDLSYVGAINIASGTADWTAVPRRGDLPLRRPPLQHRDPGRGLERAL
jgi:hypothetical protein